MSDRRSAAHDTTDYLARLGVFWGLGPLPAGPAGAVGLWAAATRRLARSLARWRAVRARARSRSRSAVEQRVELLVLAGLEHARDGQRGGALVLRQVVHGHLHALGLLLLRRLLADPHEDDGAGVEHERVVGVEVGLGDLARLLLLERQRAVGVRDAEQLLLRRALLLGLGVVAALLGRLDLVGLAAEQLPERVVALLAEHLDRRLRALVLERAAHLARLVLLEDARLRALPHEDLQAAVEHERVARVERRAAQRHLRRADLALALELQQARLVLLGLDVAEARVDAALHDAQAVREQAEEEVALEALHLAVLHGLVAEQRVELDGLVRRRARLVLRRLLAEPEVHVELDLVRARLLVRVQHNVRVAREERAVLLLRPRLHLELLDAPDLQAALLARVLPRRLGLRRRLLHVLLHIGAEQREVRVGDVDRLGLDHCGGWGVGGVVQARCGGGGGGWCAVCVSE
mmetsp:Transcript_53919/g.132182  ORF Transcript_53919/g.132182 Transcript_53919/m.132182 type:complete len:463 (-) Transcript_53919:57-1445(-)